MVLENAALFLPDGAVLLVDTAAGDSGGMADDLRDRLNFSPAPEAICALWTPDSAPVTVESARAPLWQALNKDQNCDDQPWRAKEFTFVLTRASEGGQA